MQALKPPLQNVNSELTLRTDSVNATLTVDTTPGPLTTRLLPTLMQNLILKIPLACMQPTNLDLTKHL